MNRSLFLFVHVASAMALVAALGIESVLLHQMRRATGAAGQQSALDGFRLVRPIGAWGMVLTLLSGLYLAGVYWSWRGVWWNVALVGFIVIGALGGGMTGRAITALGREPAPADGARLRGQLHTSFVLRSWLFAGILFLMTVKPAAPLSVGALVLSLVIGLVVVKVRPWAPAA